MSLKTKLYSMKFRPPYHLFIIIIYFTSNQKSVFLMMIEDNEVIFLLELFK